MGEGFQLLRIRGIPLRIHPSWFVILALFLLLPCLAIVDQFVIQREERYLAAQFGADYQAYCQTVRRWL